MLTALPRPAQSGFYEVSPGADATGCCSMTVSCDCGDAMMNAIEQSCIHASSPITKRIQSCKEKKYICRVIEGRKKVHLLCDQRGGKGAFAMR